MGVLPNSTVYHTQDMARMTSRYAIRVYELLVQWRRGSREVEIEWLRRALGIDDTYPNFKDFRWWFLEQAVSQITSAARFTSSGSFVSPGERSRMGCSRSPTSAR